MNCLFTNCGCAFFNYVCANWFYFYVSFSVFDMTSKIRQSCTSILACVAIILLLSFIIVVWMFYGSGNGRRKGDESGGGVRRNISTIYAEMQKGKVGVIVLLIFNKFKLRLNGS